MTETAATTALDHRDAVADIYAAFGRGDVPAVLAHLADDVAWEDWEDNFAQRAGVAHMVSRRGPKDVAGFFATIGAWTPLRFEVLDLLASERQVVAEIRGGFALPNGGRFHDEELHLWTFDAAGKVIRFRHYVDTAKHIAVDGGADTLGP